MLPSGPAVMNRTLCEMGNSEITLVVGLVIPILATSSANQTLPSGPGVVYPGAWPDGSVNSEMACVVGLMRPSRLPGPAENQMLPSGPEEIPSAPPCPGG